MFNILQKKNRGQIGIDIGENRIYAVAIMHTRAGFELLEANSAALNRGCNITQLLQQFEKYNYPAVVGIDYQKTIWRDFNFENSLTDTEILSHLTLHSQTHFGYPSEELHFDFCRLKNIEPNNKSIRIRTIATRRIGVNTIIDWCEKNEVNLKAIDVDATACSRAIQLFEPNYKSYQLTALIIVRHKDILFCVLKDGDLFYVKNEILSLIPDTIYRLIHYYHSSHPHLPLSHLLLNGEEEAIQPILPLLTSKTGIAAEMAFPSFQQQKLPSNLLCACGLATWGISNEN